MAFGKEEAEQETCFRCQDGRDLLRDCVPASGTPVCGNEGHPDTGADEHAERDTLGFPEGVR